MKTSKLIQAISTCDEPSEEINRILNTRKFARELLDGSFYQMVGNLSISDFDMAISTASYLMIPTKKLLDCFLWAIGESGDIARKYFASDASLMLWELNPNAPSEFTCEFELNYGHGPYFAAHLSFRFLVYSSFYSVLSHGISPRMCAWLLDNRDDRTKLAKPINWPIESSMIYSSAVKIHNPEILDIIYDTFGPDGSWAASMSGSINGYPEIVAWCNSRGVPVLQYSN